MVWLDVSVYPTNMLSESYEAPHKLRFFGWKIHKKVTSIRFTCSMNLGQWSCFGPVRQQAFRADLITFNSIGNGLSWSLAQSLLSELRYFNVQKDLSSFISMEIPWWQALDKLTFMRTLGLSGGRVGRMEVFESDEIDIFLWQHQVPKAQQLMKRTWYGKSLKRDFFFLHLVSTIPNKPAGYRHFLAGFRQKSCQG